MIAAATLVAAQLGRVDWARVFTLDTRRYAPDYLPAATADRVPWRAFAGAVPSLFRGGLDEAGLEVVVVPKSLTWSDRDVNVYLGSAGGPPLRSYQDLTEDAFVAVFGWHIAVASVLSAALGRDVYVTHGFNPQDSSPDAHSVTAKFHTHLHVPDLRRRRPVVASALSHFDRLALIEPYAVVVWDLVSRLLAERYPGSRWRAAAGFGFVTVTVPLDHLIDDDLRILYRLLADVHRSYLDLVSVFTAGHAEQATGHERYIPRPRGERHRRLSEFEASNAGWLSTESIAVLRYLAGNLAHAEPRDAPRSTRIATAGQAWIAKGLSGALNLVVSTDRASLRFDFAPRVISTSGATKVISSEPTIIRKDRGAASPADRRRMAGFHQAVVTAATTSTDPVPARRRSLPSTSSSPVPPVSSA
jgi:hypothetical protein